MRCLYDEPARGYERWQHEELAPIVTNRVLSRSFTFMLNKRRRKSDVTCFDVAMYVVPEWGLCRPTVQVGFGVLGCNMKWTVHREET